MKAPNAGENPTLAARTTIPKHMPKENIRSVSSLISLRERLRNVGMRYMPTTNHKIRKNTSFRILPTISIPSKFLLTAIVESITISTMARISSIIRILNTSPVNFCTWQAYLPDRYSPSASIRRSNLRIFPPLSYTG